MTINPEAAEPDVPTTSFWAEEAKEKGIDDCKVWLRPGSPVLDILQRMYSEQHVSPSDLRRLIDMLKKPALKPVREDKILYWKPRDPRAYAEYSERHMAVIALINLQLPEDLLPEVKSALLETLENRRPIDRCMSRYLSIRGYWRSLLVFSLLIFLLFVAAVLVGVDIEFDDAVFTASGITACLAGVAFSYYFKNWFNMGPHYLAAMRGCTAQTLGHIGADEALDTIAEELLQANKREHTECASGLYLLLPLLTPERCGQIPPKTLVNLGRVLSGRFWITPQLEIALKLRVLEAFGNVGDRRIKGAVAQVARKGKNEKLREAANHALQMIELRLSQEAEGKTLLRPSLASAQPDTLLRAASSSDLIISPDELLRPSLKETLPDE